MYQGAILRPALAVAMLWIGLAATATGAPIRYTITGSATGSLGTAAFENRAFTLVLETDSEWVSDWGADGSSYTFFGFGLGAPGSYATIALDGLPVATFTQAVELFLAQGYLSAYGNPMLSFGQGNSGLPGWAGMLASGLAGVHLNTPAGPVTSAPPLLCTSTGPRNLQTDMGVLRNTGCDSRLLTYSSTIVPVPGAAWLFGSALVLAGCLRRRLPRHAPAG